MRADFRAKVLAAMGEAAVPLAGPDWAGRAQAIRRGYVRTVGSLGLWLHRHGRTPSHESGGAPSPPVS